MTPQEVIQNLGDLPTLPQVACRAILISVEPDISMDELQDLIRMDEALLQSKDIAENITSAVRWHHDPAQAPPAHGTLVALGNKMATDLQDGFDLPGSLAETTREARDILKLDAGTCQEVPDLRPGGPGPGQKFHHRFLSP